MNIADLRAELEADQAWRLDEIRRLQNHASGLQSSTEQDLFRRPLILLVYAHFEGFCKFALTLYISSVNSVQISCAEANVAIAAATLEEIFQVLRDPLRKSALFRNTLPDDTKLHRFANEREFLERMHEYNQKPVQIPDKFVDMESNLTPSILRKNLYKLGFKYDLFGAYEGKINMLLNYRNNIAHGQTKTGVTAKDYEDVRNAAIDIMAEITRQITTALQEKWYLRTSV